jgi:hypothetical protein
MTGYHDPKQIYIDFLRSASVCPKICNIFPRFPQKENSGQAGVNKPGVARQLGKREDIGK